MVQGAASVGGPMTGIGEASRDAGAPGTKPVLLLALDQLPADVQLAMPDGTTLQGPIEVGELLMVVSVMAANVVKDIRENIRNLVGGRMVHYEKLVDAAVQTALDDLARKAQERGYDGVIGVKISHPSLVDGGVEVVVYGNGFRVIAAGG
jgi:uncharacterized protein YbjQ (UPF0145 family)